MCRFCTWDCSLLLDSLPFALKSLFPYPLADPKHVPIRMPHMHLARPSTAYRSAEKRHPTRRPRTPCEPRPRPPPTPTSTRPCRPLRLRRVQTSTCSLPCPASPALLGREKSRIPPTPPTPNVGGVPQSQHFFQPHFSNHAKLSAMSDTFKMGVMSFASIAPKHTTLARLPTDRCHPHPSFRAKWADAFSLIIAPAMKSALAARNLSSFSVPRKRPSPRSTHPPHRHFERSRPTRFLR